MKIRIWHLARPPVDGRYEAEEVCLDVDLPFVPHRGVVLGVAGPRYPLTVDHAYCDVARPEVVHVFTQEPQCLPTMQQMRAGGWLTAVEIAADAMSPAG